ncbi:hypothetical protein K435DRAFT_856927 [Dendrothele bispora CBS 962.96]|uniref:Uncharacterized protein n=1 Tax=Dendrothele bispora (strain CBS 962.96) TaxID=1314807 RepID=A0A4S8M8L2_DENBC|nr:hypothetical protein K435DRAFT_856927 [Dendrothele bispora CBS 962.96]
MNNSINTQNLFKPGRGGDRARDPDREGVVVKEVRARVRVRAETKVGKAEKRTGVWGKSEMGVHGKEENGRMWVVRVEEVGGGDSGQGKEDRDSGDGEGDGGKMVEMAGGNSRNRGGMCTRY